MFGFKKKLFGALNASKRVENRDKMQAIVGGLLLMASADGSISQAESDQVALQIRANKNLEHFGAEITKQVALYTEQLQAGFRLGKMNIMREIKDIAHDPLDAEEVIVNMITLAESENGIDEKELGVLKEVASLLGVNLANFGLK